MTRLVLSLLLAATAASCGPVVPEDARAREVVGRQHREIWSAGDFSGLEELYAPDYVGHFPGTRVEGREALRAFVTAHRDAFPDWTETVEDLIVEGNRVATRFTSTGTQRGAFLGVPATGRRVEIGEASVFHLEGGRIVEQWAYPDVSALQQQLSAAGAGQVAPGP
jgi:steroid delta-isomerase-like uncharacterized protein